MDSKKQQQPVEKDHVSWVQVRTQQGTVPLDLLFSKLERQRNLTGTTNWPSQEGTETIPVSIPGISTVENL